MFKYQVISGNCKSGRYYYLLARTPFVITPLIFITVAPPPGTYTYTFELGDGNTISGSSLSIGYTYTKPGTYQVKVITTDLVTGCVDSSNAYPMVVNGPTAKFTTPTVLSCSALNAVFTDQSTVPAGSSITSWAWDFGDGGTSTSPAPPAHPYTFQGIFPVKLRVTDNNGCSDSLTIPNYITVSIPVAKFATDDSNYCPASNIKFNNLSTGGFNPVYTWDFKDGTIYNGANPPLHNFPLVGKYPVSLTVNGCL